MFGFDLLTVKTVNALKKSLYFRCHEELSVPYRNDREAWVPCDQRQGCFQNTQNKTREPGLE